MTCKSWAEVANFSSVGGSESAMPNGCEASCQDLMLNKKGDGRWKALLTGWGSPPQPLPQGGVYRDECETTFAGSQELPKNLSGMGTHPDDLSKS